jgi:leucyl/phenylalanyl-tRNA--protein transferase
VALVGLVELLAADPAGAEGRRLIDVQWPTPHLRSLGVSVRSRAAYVAGLEALLAVPEADFTVRSSHA